MRLPLLSGSRVGILNLPDDTVVLRPRRPAEPIADVGAATRDALRYPLSGPPLEELVAPNGRVTIVVEPPALPVPGAMADPRRDALAATIDELERIGVASERQTILVAGGLSRRAGNRELEALLPPVPRRAFHGSVVVHDAESPDLVAIAAGGRTPLRVNRALVETDAVVVVSAAETVLHGGAAALVRAAAAPVVRAAGAYSLLETAASRGWKLALALEKALAAQVPLIGASLVLDQPRLGGAFRGYPWDDAALRHLERSPLRRLSALPAAVRHRYLDGVARDVGVAAAFAGAPSVAHAEALLRGVARRAVRLDEPLDALVVGLPWMHHHHPRERLNPITVAAAGLGLALRLWRDAFPLRDDGTVILLHRLTRHFAPSAHPYRTLFGQLREGLQPDELPDAERAAAEDAGAIAAYRGGRACHPLQAYADWDSCRPALDRAGSVVVAGCRDHAAARTLGFVPTHGFAPALEMAHGRAGGHARIGVLLGPPYFPIEVGGR
ncbi:MAG TPA: lactate racemase domain-containing protein [Gaiellaceae bacterium]|nr:lactate racemase domain-containing protein [Gaiellaceae bacterium]